MALTEEQLKKSRTVIKATVTRISNFVKNFEGDEYDQLEHRNVRLDSLSKEYNDIQMQLELLDSTYENDRDNFESAYFNAKSEISKILKLKRVASESRERESTPGLSEASHRGNDGIKLPRINIPIFNGDYQQWQNFYDMFNSLVDQNNELSRIQKFYYLKSQLSGEAAKTIESIGVNSENYKEAWKLLIGRYNNKQYIVNSHLKALFEIPTITKDSANGLRNLITDGNQHLRSLKTLGLPTDMWDDIIVYLLTQKLDHQARREWELSKPSDTQILQTLKDFFAFLEKRSFSLEALSISSDKPRHKQLHSYVGAAQEHKISCKLCNGDHKLHKCGKLLKEAPPERLNIVKRLKLCLNCVRSSHNVAQCKSTFVCRLCQRKHHTLLHLKPSTTELDTSVMQKQNDQPQTVSANVSVASLIPRQNLTLQTLRGTTEILLATAVIGVKDVYGHWQMCRALLDSGSQTNFITNKLIERLGFKTEDKFIPIGGIGQVCTEANKSVTLHISSRVASYNKILEFAVLDKITSNLPAIKFYCNSWKIPLNIDLADPTFNIPAEIDMPIGAEVFLNILKSGTYKLEKGFPLLQNTEFGYVISGKIENCFLNVKHQVCLLSTESLSNQVKRFWEIEENYHRKHLSDEEKACEQHYQENVSRDESGHYVVKLPFKIPTQTLGESAATALKRFNALERKFKQDETYEHQYQEFLKEYYRLGHMKEVKNDDHTKGYYMPHHAVLKEASLSTKIRVVFDASAVTNNGLSLNDTLMVGPTIQEDVFAILLRFRLHKYVITADIEKMYRQIQVHEDHKKYQKILWRHDQNNEVKTFELQTVTYGTASAPDLAIRTLHQLADDEQEYFPLAAKILKRDFYVDDVLTGGSTIEETTTIRNGLMMLLKKGGFDLRKWSSNDTRLLENLKDISNSELVQLDTTKTHKMLGLQWNAQTDIILYSFHLDQNELVTKRNMSQIAKLYDPLGLLGPMISKAKILMQSLWRDKTHWDETVSLSTVKFWEKYKSQLSKLNNLNIPRKAIFDHQTQIQLHGFCDASEDAYGACIYVRSNNNDCATVHLLCAKSRVAPLKQLSLPRLELSAALLLANLQNSVTKAIHIQVDNIISWTDSKITLAWINTPAYKLKTFVANRVAEIQKLTRPHNWRWISTQDNPADIISRGCLPEDLINNNKWWNGPKWLSLNELYWPKETENTNICETMFELKPVKNVCLVSTSAFTLFERYSVLSKLQRTTAYCLRFIRNTAVERHQRQFGPLSIDELNRALMVLIKVAQRENFSEEIQLLHKANEVKPSSKLRSLSPFLDSDGIIRVGGRLVESQLTYQQKHPIILPNKHALTKLILKQEHLKLMHGGTQILLNHIRQMYWPINGRNQIKGVIRKCLRCLRTKANNMQTIQRMGNLPDFRFETIRPFYNVGVDYGGPIFLRSSKLRKVAIIKSYIALFICMSTKAIHLELVTSLTTHDFLSAFRRFISRRGKPSKVYSDNGTNFQGAAKELREMCKFLQIEDTQHDIITSMAAESIEWHFIPPGSPNFGGLWEAEIKTVKTHIKRVIGDTYLTYDEMYTLLVQVEGCANSRPITPIYDEISDPSVLTPAHFLIGAPLTNIPEHDLTDLKINRLSRWQLVQKMFQHFWKRWVQEYLHHLQQRRKWTQESPNLEINDIVLIKDELTSPLRWKLGRIIEVHPGKDNKVRVVTVRGCNGTYKKSVSKLIKLPVED